MRSDLSHLLLAWAHTVQPYCVGFQQDQPRAGGMPPFPAFLFNFSMCTALLPGHAVPGQYLICKQTLQQAHLCCRLQAICCCSQPAHGRLLYIALSEMVSFCKEEADSEIRLLLTCVLYFPPSSPRDYISFS